MLCRVGYFIAASSVIYIVLVASLLKDEPTAAAVTPNGQNASGSKDGSLARQVRGRRSEREGARQRQTEPQRQSHTIP